MITDGLELLEGSTIINMTVASGAAFPSSPSTGELFYKTSATTGLYTYDGAGWVAAGGGGSAMAINDQVGTTYTPVLTDANDYIRMSNTAQQVVTVPLNSSVAFAVGDTVEIYRAGSGFVTIDPAVGVTINSDRVSINADNSATLVNVAVDNWDFVGQNSPLFTDNSVEYTNKFMSTSVEDPNPRDSAFSSDGTKMYIVGYGVGSDTDVVNQYTLSSAWDVSTATYASKSLLVVAQDTQATGITFSADGTKLYIAGNSTNSVYQYTLTIAWDISTATYAAIVTLGAIVGGSGYDASFTWLAEPLTGGTGTGATADITTDAGGIVTGVTIVNSGTNYTAADSLSAALVGSLSGTGFTVAVSTVSAALSTSVVGEEAGPQGLEFSSDGTKMYIVGSTADRVHQYTLSPAWDVSTATYASKFVSIVPEDNSPQGIAFNSDGTKMYIAALAYDKVYRYTLTVAWDVSTATYANKSVSVTLQETSPSGVTFSSDGAIMYIVGYGTDKVYQYDVAI